MNKILAAATCIIALFVNVVVLFVSITAFHIIITPCMLVALVLLDICVRQLMECMLDA